MTVVLGSEAQGAEAAIGAVLEKGIAIRVQATATCKVKKIKLKTTAGTGNKIILGVREDSAGAVGAIMSETGELTVAPTTEGELNTEISIVNGTFYWLCLLTTVGSTTKVKSAAGECKKTSGAIKKLSEGTWTGSQLKYSSAEPGFWAEEVVGGETVFSGTIVEGLGLTQVTAGSKSSASSVVNKVGGLTNLIAGFKSTTGTIVNKVGGLTNIIAGLKSTVGELAQKAGLRQLIEGGLPTETFAGTLAQALGLKQTTAGKKATTATLAQKVALGQKGTATKTTTGQVAQKAAFGQVGTAFKVTVGVVNQAVGVLQAIVGQLPSALAAVFGRAHSGEGIVASKGEEQDRETGRPGE
jgi:hypothetical protein